jgi:hypothetical protein
MTDAKVRYITIGLLSKMKLTHTHPDGYTIDVLYGHTNQITDAAVQAIGDLQEGINIGPNVNLRYRSQEDNKILERFPDPNNDLQHQLNKYILESSLDIENENDKANSFESIDFTSKCIRNVVTAFRLVNPEFIEANIKLTVSNKSDETFMTTEHGFQVFVPYRNFKQYALELKEILEVRTLAQKLATIDFSRRGTMRIALDRFGRSYYEVYPEDQLIDYMIAFEAMFVGKNIQEKSAVISVATAMLIGKTDTERQEVSEILKTAYKVRNQIVHGSDYANMKSPEMLSLICKVENILRDCIKKLL